MSVRPKTQERIMDKVQIEQINTTQFSVEELEQRLEMTAAAGEMEAAGRAPQPGEITIDWGGLHWWIG